VNFGAASHNRSRPLSDTDAINTSDILTVYPDLIREVFEKLLKGEKFVDAARNLHSLLIELGNRCDVQDGDSLWS
jgi:hypothetical protein